MKTLPPLLEQHRNQLRDESPWFWLFAVRVPTTPATWYRLTNNLETVHFGVDSDGVAIPYYSFPIVHGGFNETSEGDIPTLQITVGNASLEIARAVDLYDGLIGAQVIVRLVNAADLSNPQSEIREDCEVRRAGVSGESVVFILSAYNLYKPKFPPWRYSSYSCKHQFGGVECGYALVASPGDTVGTGFSFCRKTLAQCERRGADEAARSVTVQHPKRFGAFPGIPRNLGGA